MNDIGKDNTRAISESDRTLKVVPCNCKSGFCPHCKWRNYFKWLDRLKPVLKTFKSVMMITFTVDPKKFSGPAQAWSEVMGRRWIAKTVAKIRRAGFLESERFFYVLEFHKSGWPHWHLVVESAFIPHEMIERAWGYGFVSYSKKTEFANSDHAVYYLLKYVGKNDSGYPEWVLHHPGRIRLVATSRGLVETEKREKNIGKKNPRKTKTIAQRIKGCGEQTVVVSKVPKMGGEGVSFLGMFPVRFKKEMRDWTKEQVLEWVKNQAHSPTPTDGEEKDGKRAA